jgi:integrase
MIAAGTATNANRVQALVSKIFSFAVDAELMAANPCIRLIKRGAENRGRRVLSDDELRIFWSGIIEKPISRSVGLALRIAALTGCRVSEVAEAELSEFTALDDPERASWTIPEPRSKNKLAHFVPLSPLALEAVREAISVATEAEARRAARAGGAQGAPIAPAHLFPSPTNRLAPITGHALSVAMIRFSKALADRGGAPTWAVESPSPHDLRRTVATRLSGLRIPAEDVSAVLNHKRRDVTAVHYDLYDRASEKKRALNLWSETLSAIVSHAV